jgi:hypothetical protein
MQQHKLVLFSVFVRKNLEKNLRADDDNTDHLLEINEPPEMYYQLVNS